MKRTRLEVSVERIKSLVAIWDKGDAVSLDWVHKTDLQEVLSALATKKRVSSKPTVTWRGNTARATVPVPLELSVGLCAAARSSGEWYAYAAILRNGHTHLGFHPTRAEAKAVAEKALAMMTKGKKR